MVVSFYPYPHFPLFIAVTLVLFSFHQLMNKVWCCLLFGDCFVLFCYSLFCFLLFYFSVAIVLFSLSLGSLNHSFPSICLAPSLLPCFSCRSGDLWFSWLVFSCKISRRKSLIGPLFFAGYYYCFLSFDFFFLLFYYCYYFIIFDSFSFPFFLPSSLLLSFLVIVVFNGKCWLFLEFFDRRG